MEAKRSLPKVQVRRITVDEQLGEALFRVLVARLATGVQWFFDREDDWQREREVLVRPGNYLERLGISPSEREKWSWEELEEGQVFLSGEFEIVGKRKEPDYFVISPGKEEFLRLDKVRALIEGTQQTCSNLLRR